MPSCCNARPKSEGGVPLGLAQHPKLLRPARQGQCLNRDDVAVDMTTAGFRLRREMEVQFEAAH